MSHLLADLTGYHDPFWGALVVLAALCGAFLLMILLRQATSFYGWRRAGLVAVGGLASTGISWGAFLAAFKSTYPQIAISIPPSHAASSLTTSLAFNLFGLSIAAAGRRSGRNVLLAGSLLSFGFSCMVFTSMSGMVSPYALSYDLSAVLLVMIFGALLASFAISEIGKKGHNNSLAIGTLLGGAAIAFSAFGSLSSILSFGDWMSAVAEPDDLTASPIVVIGAAEAVTVLVLSFVGSLADHRAAARDKLEAERLRQLANSTFEAIVIHRDGSVLDGNEALASLLGVRENSLAGQHLGRIVPEGATPFWTANRSSTRGESEIVTATGQRLPIEMLSRTIPYRGSLATVTALRDISERRDSEARIRFLAHHDMLTALPNRALLTEELENKLAAATEKSDTLAVLCLDLDGFKLVNDTYGHATGDELLRQVAARLRAAMREGEFVARIGGDEFVVLQSSGTQPGKAGDLAQRIIAALTSPFDPGGRRVTIGTSVGVAIFPRDGAEPNQLVKRADIALYRAKHNGRGCVRFFDAAVDHEVDDRPQLEQELRDALAKGELSLAYQPIFDCVGKLVSFEALMRWTHPVLGPISPARFIPIAESRQLILPMGEWALREACRTAATWAGDIRVAVNLSPVQVVQKDLLSRIDAVLRETGLSHERLELEITEGVLLKDEEAACDVITALGKRGVRIVLDDFGTGYSSLSYLHRFRFDKLKIDRSFIHRLLHERSAQAIVKAIISMSRDLGMEVTAEGVETTEQMEALTAQSCHELQGFLLGRPMPGEDANRLALEHGAEGGLRELERLRTAMGGGRTEAVSAA